MKCPARSLAVETLVLHLLLGLVNIKVLYSHTAEMMSNHECPLEWSTSCPGPKSNMVGDIISTMSSIYPPWCPNISTMISRSSSIYHVPGPNGTMASLCPAVQRFSKQTGAWPLTFRNSFFAGWVDGWAPKIYKKKPWNLTWNLYMSSMDFPFPILSNMGFLRIALGYTSNSDKSRDVFPTRSA